MIIVNRALSPSIARLGAHQREAGRLREERAKHAHRGRDHHAEHDHLHGRLRRAIGILLADAARHHRRRANRERHRHRVDDRQHRLGEPDRRHRVGAQLRDEEDVDDGEERLHAHLHHHGDGEDDERGADGAVA